MIVIKLMLLFSVFFIVPILLGGIGSRTVQIQETDFCIQILWQLVIGWVVMWAAFQLLAVPNILAMNSMRIVTISWCMVLLLCIVAGVIRTRPWKQCRFGRRSQKAVNRMMVVYVMLALIPIAYQCYLYIFQMHLDEDDSRFIANAVRAYETNRMLLDNPATGEVNVQGWISEYNKDVVAPWPIFLGMLAKLVRMHPAILAHTVYAPYLLLLSYVIFFLMGFYLFGKKKEQALLFVAAIAYMQFFFSGSARTASEFSLVRIWQGKAAFAAIGIPFLFLIFIYLYSETRRHRADVRRSALLLGITDIACCMMSSNGIVISGLIIFALGVWYVVVYRKWKAFPIFVVSCGGTVFFGIIFYLLRIGQMVG